jgi:hypothetical protein
MRKQKPPPTIAQRIVATSVGIFEDQFQIFTSSNEIASKMEWLAQASA